MATNYPGAVDSFTNPQPGDSQDNPSHAGQHTDANDAIVAVQTVLGTGYEPGDSVITELETLADSVAGKLAKGGNVTLAAADGTLLWVDIDGEDSNGPDRFRFRVGTRLVSWFNEFGEIRVIPSSQSRVGVRAFASPTETEHGTRNAAVPVFEVANDRQRRDTVMSVNKNGQVYTAGGIISDEDIEAPNIGVPIEGVLDAEEEPSSGAEIGSIWLVRES